MKKALKITVKIILIIPISAIALFILWEILGIICNNIAGSRQTENVVELSETSFGEVCDYDTFVGNSGNGNHVDLVTTCIIGSDKTAEEITDELLKEYSFTLVYPLEEIAEKSDGLEFPEDWQDGSYYYITIINSAPFSDNIMGH